MRSVGVHQAKTHFSALLRDVLAGEEIEIRRGAIPVARLVPVRPKGRRVLGYDEGRVFMSDDFDAPMPDDFLDAFES